MTLYRLLAIRFLFNMHEKSIKAMIRICFISIVISSGALTLVSAIMNGFEYKTRALIQSIHPDIIISGGSKSLKYTALKQALMHDYGMSIAGISSRSQANALIQDTQEKADATPVLIIAIDPETEPTISALECMILGANKSLSALLGDHGVLVGSTLGQQLGTCQESPATLLYQSTADESEFAKDQVMINGFIKTGIDEFDTHVVLMSQTLFNEFFPDRGVTRVGIKCAPGITPQTLITQLSEKFPALHVYAWYDMYPALLSALTLERYAMFFILALITLVASMNIVALLYMYLNNKRTEIAVLRTLGASARSITTLFTGIGMSIALSATVLGVSIAAGISIILDRYQLIRLPEAYYVSHLPAQLDFSTIIAIFFLVIIISFFASHIPARRMQRLNIPTTLRQLG